MSMDNQLEQAFNEEFDFSIAYNFYNFIKKNPFISIYVNGKRYFLFSLGGQIYSLPESLLSFFIFSLSFFGVVGLRKLFKKYEVKKNLQKILKKIKKKPKTPKALQVRGGVGAEDVLHYEVDVIDDGKNSFPIIFSKLTSDEKFVKAILKKCLKPNRFYKISNRGLLEVVSQMMDFNKKDNTRIISYDVFILALLTYAKPMSPIIYEGTMKLVQKLGYSAFIKNAPLIISLALGIIGGLGANLAGRNVFISFCSTLPTWFGSYRLAEYSRNALAIDCTDYVEELPVQEKYALAEGPLALESETNQNSKVSFSLSKPTRHETFVSTAPGQELHYEEKIQLETLDGFYKEAQKLNGQKTVVYRPHKPTEIHQVAGSRFAPLDQRTRTMDDIRDLDSTRNRESAENIRDHIVKEQIAMRILDEFLE